VLPTHAPAIIKMKSTICIAEDRKSCEPCVRLLILSLHRHSPEREVDLFYPATGAEFLAWLSNFPNVRIHPKPLGTGLGWNIKPHAILHLLERGFDEVIWIDSDILITANIFDMVSTLDQKTLVATDHTLSPERDDTNALRCRLWRLDVGRVLPAGLSSGFVRATKFHYRLMREWCTMLQSEEYQRTQKIPWKERPVHMLGDQDVLTALLTSSEFSDVPLFVLRRGKHIIQFDGVWGYSLTERLRNLIGDGPAMIHSGGGKPWTDSWYFERSHGVKQYLRLLYLDLSPYTSWAIQLRDQLGCDAAWMRSHFRMTSILRWLGFGRPELVGLPLAAFADFTRALKWTRSLFRPRTSIESAKLTESRTASN
jgi:hypothetical protein